MTDLEGELEGISGSVGQPNGSLELWESWGVWSPRCESGDKLVFNRMIHEVQGVSEGVSEESDMGM